MVDLEKIAQDIRDDQTAIDKHIEALKAKPNQETPPAVFDAIKTKQRETLDAYIAGVKESYYGEDSKGNKVELGSDVVQAEIKTLKEARDKEVLAAAKDALPVTIPPEPDNIVNNKAKNALDAANAGSSIVGKIKDSDVGNAITDQVVKKNGDINWWSVGTAGVVASLSFFGFGGMEAGFLGLLGTSVVTIVALFAGKYIGDKYAESDFAKNSTASQGQGQQHVKAEGLGKAEEVAANPPAAGESITLVDAKDPNNVQMSLNDSQNQQILALKGKMVDGKLVVDEAYKSGNTADLLAAGKEVQISDVSLGQNFKIPSADVAKIKSNISVG